MGCRRGRKGLFPYSEINKTLENEYKFNSKHYGQAVY